MTIRVLHCPTDTGRNAWTLAQAEKQLGVDSTVLVFHRAWLNYPADIDLKTRELSPLGKAATIGKLILRAARDYDIIHFNAGRSLLKASPGPFPWLSRADLAYFKAMGKGIVVTYQGCDVRQKSQCEVLFEINGCSYCTNPCSPELDAHKAYMVRGFDKYADAIYSLNPDLLHVLPQRAEFLPYTTIDPAEWRPEPMTSHSDRFTILHAPTNRGLKGTEFVLAAVERLKERHPEVELVIVEGVPHEKVLELYARADLVLDQLLLGWYGGFAVEAMALGRPVMCYIREDDLRYIPAEMAKDIPVINANPATVLDALEETFANRSMLPEIGRKSRAYVEKWHDPLKIARGVVDRYEEVLTRR